VAWGEGHFLVSAMIQKASRGRWWIALPLAIASHWPLDDLNIGRVGRIYHGVGNDWRAVVTSILRIPVWVFIFRIVKREPKLLISGLAGWLVLDHEWLAGWFRGTHGYGLHERMWPNWMKGEWGLLPWFASFFLMILLLLPPTRRSAPRSPSGPPPKN